MEESIMAFYPNQKHFIIHRINPITEKKQYLAISTENLAIAARNLSGEVAFKFYIYLAANRDNYSLDYSPQHFANIYGISIDSARRAADKLIEAGYLVKNENYKNTYDFFEVSQKKEDKPKIKSAVLEEKRFIEQDNGELIKMTYPELFEELKDYYPPEVIKAAWDDAKEAQ